MTDTSLRWTATSLRKALAPPSAAVVLPPADAIKILHRLARSRIRAAAIVLDPPYNKGKLGTRDDYGRWLVRVVRAAAKVADHVFVWGFSEILGPLLTRMPTPLRLVSWLVWVARNVPSVARGWRPAHQACLHLARPRAKLHLENFLKGEDLEKLRAGKLRFLPSPMNVIEAGALVGAIGRAESTGHPTQKPLRVIEPLIRMATREGDLVVDPFAGSGTTAVAARRLGRRALVCDADETFTEMMEGRLGVSRVAAAKARNVNPLITGGSRRLTADEREKRRRRAVRLVGTGLSFAEVGRHVGVSREAVRRWTDAAREGGTEALQSRPRRTPAAKIDPTRIVLLVRRLEREGEGRTPSVSFLAREIERRLHVRYTPDHLRRLLRQIGP